MLIVHTSLLVFTLMQRLCVCACLHACVCVCICIQLWDEKEGLSLELQQLTQDCNMHQQKNTMIQNQMRELQAERDQVRNC